jgi:hypothetical protein
MGALALLVLGPPLGALDEPREKPKQEPSSAQERLEALMQEVIQKRQEVQRAYQKAMTETTAAYADRFLELAAKHPDDPAGFEALAWVVGNVGVDPRRDRALDLLLQHQVENPKIGTLCTRLATNLTPAGEKLLRAILEKNPNREAQGLACYSLALGLKNRIQRGGGGDVEKMVAEATELFQRVSTDYANVKSGNAPLATLARSQSAGLGAMARLSVGKVAPEIEGEDIDGVKFKLSDYRGKVVVLDFWGHW